MALLLRRLRPTTMGFSRTRHAPGSCDRSKLEPCPPCVPAPPPPCRVPDPTSRPALRKVCCPPPAGCRPPCAAPVPPCARTCDTHAAEIQIINTSKNEEESNVTATEVAQTRCALVTDLVASRLAAAKQARRRSYELEVASRRRHAPPDCTTYRPEGEWSRVRATDGHDYAIPCDAEPPAPCSPDGTPPPPTVVKLKPDAHCRPHARPDPCSHRPRILLQIDRSSDPKRVSERDHQHAAPASKVKNKKCDRQSTVSSPPGLTERIMRTLTLGRGTTKRVEDNKRVAGECSRRRCAPPCPPSARAGDDGWCSRMPPPAPAPHPCREPSVAERLCRRPGAPRCGGRANRRRSFHTAARLHNASDSVGRDTDKIVADTKRDAKNLKAVLEERRALKRAGRGREEVCGGTVSSVGHGAGRLELQLRLDSAVIAMPPQKKIEEKCKSDPEIEKPPRKVCSPSKPAKKDSWLSIKSLQRKLSNGKKKDNPAPSKSAPICPPPLKPAPCPPPTKSPCKNPCAPPNSPCEDPGPKHKPCPPPTAPPSQPMAPRSKPCDTTPKPKKLKYTGFTPNMIFIKP